MWEEKGIELSKKLTIQRHQLLFYLAETQQERLYHRWSCIKQSFYMMGGLVVALMVRFMIVLILIGLMDEHSIVGSKNYFFQIWMVMALFAIIGQLLELPVLGSRKRSWRSLQKLFKNYISQATFSAAFERPFEWHKTRIFVRWVSGNRNITT